MLSYNEFISYIVSMQNILTDSIIRGMALSASMIYDKDHSQVQVDIQKLELAQCTKTE